MDTNEFVTETYTFNMSRVTEDELMEFEEYVAYLPDLGLWRRAFAMDFADNGIMLEIEGVFYYFEEVELYNVSMRNTSDAEYVKLKVRKRLKYK